MLRPPALLSLLVALAVAQDLRVYHIDVEQADATLFVAPGGKTLLVDAGNNGAGDEIKAVMDTAGVTKIDFFVCTHYHSDHYGGIDDLALADPEGLGVMVGKAYDRGAKDLLPTSRTSQATYKDYQTAVGSSAEQIEPGTTIPLDAAMTVTCVASGRKVIGDTTPTPGSDENNNSVALRIDFGEFRYFVGGDMHTETEEDLAEHDLVLDADVYQANHHGSDTSSADALLLDMKPTVVVISNGSDAGYDHPRQSTLNRLAALMPSPTVFQTNEYDEPEPNPGGNVADQFIGDLVPNDKNGTILVTVNAAATQYTVLCRGQTFTFAVKGASPPGVVIASLLPDPVGSDRQNEVVTLRNDSAAPISVDGWRLVDADGHFDTLLGTIPPFSTMDVVRNGSPLSLNNDGDVIRLMDADGVVVDEVAYGAAAQGEVVPGH